MVTIKMCMGEGKQNGMNKIMSYNCIQYLDSEATPGLRLQYEQRSTQNSSSLLVAVLNTAQSYRLLKEVNRREKAKDFQALCCNKEPTTPRMRLFYLLIISFGCKLITLIFIF